MGELIYAVKINVFSIVRTLLNMLVKSQKLEIKLNVAVRTIIELNLRIYSSCTDFFVKDFMIMKKITGMIIKYTASEYVENVAASNNALNKSVFFVCLFNVMKVALIASGIKLTPKIFGPKSP